MALQEPPPAAEFVETLIDDEAMTGGLTTALPPAYPLVTQTKALLRAAATPTAPLSPKPRRMQVRAGSDKATSGSAVVSRCGVEVAFAAARRSASSHCALLARPPLQSEPLAATKDVEAVQPSSEELQSLSLNTLEALEAQAAVEKPHQAAVEAQAPPASERAERVFRKRFEEALAQVRSRGGRFRG